MGESFRLIERTKKMEDRVLPGALDYTEISGLRREAQLKLQEIRPRTLGQAGRIQGVTPADISLLTVWLEKVK